jgi:hypothetical protein
MSFKRFVKNIIHPTGTLTERFFLIQYKQRELKSRRSDKVVQICVSYMRWRLTRASNDTLEKRSLIIIKGSEGKTGF